MPRQQRFLIRVDLRFDTAEIDDAFFGSDHRPVSVRISDLPDDEEI